MAGTKRKAAYDAVIRQEAARLGLIGKVDPRHVEGWMRLEYGTLDHLPREKFGEYVQVAIDCERAQPGSGESLAQTYGM